MSRLFRGRGRASGSALAIALALHGAADAADPVYVGSIREGLTAPMSLAVDGDRIVVLEPYTRQIAVYSADGFVQQRLDIDARARGVARLGPTVYLFCDRGRAAVRAVDVAQSTTRVFLDGAGDPVDVAVEGGRCYVLDARSRIIVTDAAGAVQGTVPLALPDGSGLASPSSFVRDAARGRFHVLDQVTCTVTSFATDGTYLGAFCSFGSEDGQVTRGGEIACDEEGRVYVCDRFQGRVAVFEASGDFLCNIDPLELGAEPLVVPTGIAVDANGLVYVASLESRGIQLFYVDSAAAGPLSAHPFHPADWAGVDCGDDLRLVAGITSPAGAPAPVGADFRLLQGDDAVVMLAEATNLPVVPAAGAVGADSLVAEWRPELECVDGAVYAWQVRARSDAGVGPWSSLRWFQVHPTSVTLHLGRNFPNPFRARTAIPFQAPAGADVRLQVFDLHGRVVWTRVQADLPGGYNEITWDGCDAGGERVAAGVFFYRLTSGAFTATRKLVLLR